MTKIKNITIFGRDIIEQTAVTQLENCVSENDIGVLTADAHKGYAHPIGGAIAYKGRISVSGVGFDIACGNKAVETNIRFTDIEKDLPKIMDEIYSRISFGMGKHNNEKIDHQVIDKITNANFEGQRKLAGLAEVQLGTVGGGNHFIDLFKDVNGFVWIGVHFGSRGFGHKTATGFIAMSQGLSFNDKGKEGSMDSLPIIFDTDSTIGQEYIEAMSLAGEYAYAGRDTVVNKVLEILGNPEVLFSVHNHHNFAWLEEHYGEEYWVVRKGCTPAFPEQYGFIGSNMKDYSVIIKGVDSELSRKSLYSTVHGAGRVMSRTQAAGKKKWIAGTDGKKRPTLVAKGCVDFDKVQEEMKLKGVQLRGAGADEAPECYKKLSEVLNAHKDTIEIIHLLEPVGVAMAGDTVYDPYKD